MDTFLGIRLGTLLVSLVAAVAVWFPSLDTLSTSPNLQVHFLDVGQGDSIFIQTPDGVDVLVDGGPNSVVLSQLSKFMSPFDRQIDMVVGTHPDKDHIGGLVDVLGRYEVYTILTTENKSDSAIYSAYTTAIKHEDADVIYARRGQTFTLGASTTLEVLFPETGARDMESNASSIVLKLVYGETEVLLTGDSPKRIEEYLVLTQGEHLRSDVLKAGHHGSRTSTSELFLEEVDPQYAVISAGKNNRYGHPHVEVTDMLFNHRIKIYSTAEEGTVTFVSDGKNLWKE